MNDPGSITALSPITVFIVKFSKIAEVELIENTFINWTHRDSHSPNTHIYTHVLPCTHMGFTASCVCNLYNIHTQMEKQIVINRMGKTFIFKFSHPSLLITSKWEGWACHHHHLVNWIIVRVHTYLLAWTLDSVRMTVNLCNSCLWSQHTGAACGSLGKDKWQKKGGWVIDVCVKISGEYWKRFFPRLWVSLCGLSHWGWRYLCFRNTQQN